MRGAWLGVAFVLVGVAAACAQSFPPPTSQPTSTVGSPSNQPVTVTTLLDAGTKSPPPPAAPAPDAGPKLCGCALCAPLFSDDPCTTDADCAPATPCHAARCVAKAKAEPRGAGTMCTQVMMCGTADANACGCVSGRCALHAR